MKQNKNFAYISRTVILSGLILFACCLASQAQTVMVQYTTTSDFGSGFTGEIKITNTGTQAISGGWTLAFDFAPTINSISNATVVSRVGNRYTIRDAGFNATIPAGGNVTVGIVGSPGNPSPPTNYVFNGAPVGVTQSTFTYQGRLSEGAAAAIGAYDLQFALYDEAGTQIGATLTRDDVIVTNGIFTVLLDFGAAAFPGANRLLEIRVRAGNSTGAYATLSPRQPVTSTPQAINASSLGGITAANYLQTTGNGATLTNLNAANIASGTLDDARLSSNVALRNSANTFTSNQFFTGNLSQTGTTTDLNLTNGFLTRGALSTGEIPTTGAGVRMMFYPGKAAFRTGRIDGDQWDDANIGILSIALGNNVQATNRAAFAAGEGTLASGQNSTALGYLTRASGSYSTALSYSTTASGNYSTSMGYNTTASGNYSTSMGYLTTASGQVSTALGFSTTASGFFSTALGNNASTNNKAGSFVYGDNSSSSIINATTNNQFVVRTQHIWLGNNNVVTNTTGRFLETSTGAYLSTSGVWTDNSSRDLKTNFSTVDSRDVLRKVLGLNIQMWNYKTDPSDIRHIGVMSQDFFQAFRVGADDEHLTAVDTAGVMMAAIQGLNAELKDELQTRDNQIISLQQQLKEQQTQIDALKKLLCANNAMADVCR